MHAIRCGILLSVAWSNCSSHFHDLQKQINWSRCHLVCMHGAKRLCIWQRHPWKEAVPGWQNLSAADILKIIHKMAAAMWPTDTSNLATYDDETSLAFHKVAYGCWVISHSWASGRASGLKKLTNEVLTWLSVWSKVQVVCMWSSWCHCIPKPHHLRHFN